MSDHGKPAAYSDSFRGVVIRRPQDPHQLQRMGHRKHVGSISASSIHRSLADDADVHKECPRGGQNLPAQFWKPKVVGTGNTEMPDHGSPHVISGSLPSVEDIKGKGALNIIRECLGKENTRTFEAERMILSKTSLCRMESTCVDWKNVESSPFFVSGIVSSEWQQCAEFNVNHKTQNVLQSKRKHRCWDARLDRAQLQTTRSEFALAPEKVKSLPDESQFQAEYMMQQSRLYRIIDKKRLPSSGPLKYDCMGSTSGYEPNGFSRTPDAGPSISAREGNVQSTSGIVYKENLENHSRLIENKVGEPCSHSLLTFSEKKRDKKLISGRSWPMPRDWSPKACGDSSVDVSGNELLLIKRSSMQGFMEPNESFCRQHFQQSILGFSMHELRRCTTVDSVARSSGMPVNYEKDGGQSVDDYSADMQNESHVRTGCLADAPGVKTLSEGVTSARSDKKDFTRRQKLRKLESTSALQLKEAIMSNQGTELPDRSLDSSPCIGTADPVDPKKGLGTSRGDSMDVEHIVSEVGKAEKPGSSQHLLEENSLVPDVSSRWVKRLKVNSDSVGTGTGDCNMDDVMTTRRVHNLLSKVMNYSRSNSFTLAKCLQERQQFQKTMLLLRNNDSPVDSLQESHPWIQRWCPISEEAAHPKTRKPIEVLYEPERTRPLPENLEGKLFPSLAAMALMGKSFNNFRPCEVRRRGSSLVWNTEGF